MAQDGSGPQLPAQRTPLIGREREIAEARQLLLYAKVRLLTLTGVGGSGKTRLALQLAAELAPAFPHRVWLVELAPVADPALVPQTVAAAVGIQEAVGRGFLDALVDCLAPEPALLVLDNCEHLVNACASLAERLLAACPDLRLLATSRETLQIAGEHQRRVPPLAVPDPDHLPALAELAQAPAVRLFVARAQAVDPGFRLTPQNAAAVARVCARVDGIPLALELAAARVRVLAVEQILERLDDAVRLLTGGSRAGPTRQQTLRATLEWGEALLSEAERAVFRRLAVFAGGWTLEAAEAVCAGAVVDAEDVLDLLTRLVDKSLVLVEAAHNPAWYRLLEPVRQYGARRLAEQRETDATRARHAVFYLDLAERAALRLRGPEQGLWLARLAREQGNLRAALGWAAERGACGDPEPGLRLATALAPFWEAHGHLVEGRRWLQAALTAPWAGAVESALRARALAGAGRLAHMQSRPAEASALHAESLALSRALDDQRGIAAALVELGMAQRRQLDLAGSARLLEEGLAQYRALGDPAGIAFALLNLGATARVQGDGARATRLLTESLALFREQGDLRHVAITEAMLGLAALQEGVPERAAAHLTASLAGHQRLGDRWFILLDLLGLAGVLDARGRPGEAARLFGAAEALGDGLEGSLAHVGGSTYAPFLAAAGARLREPPFAAAWAEGRSLSLDRAVAYALAAVGASEPGGRAAPAPPARPAAETLTRREREVALLLARGNSDRQVADALSIGTGTAGVHVHRILDKLGLRSRHQVAEWAVAQGLVERPGD